MLEQLSGYDWAKAFECCGPPDGRDETWGADNLPDVRTHPGSGISTEPFQRNDVTELAYIAEGENDGPTWVCVGLLADGRWFALSAGCDYTGWDCQSGGSAHVAATREDAARLGLDDSERARLGLSAAGVSGAGDGEETHG